MNDKMYIAKNAADFLLPKLNSKLNSFVDAQIEIKIQSK